MAHDAFISYSKKDKPTADAICATLESQNIRCWIAPRDILPGTDWGEAIIQAIAHSRIMILIFSSNANHSNQVKREVERAASKGIPIAPFRIEDVPFSEALEYYLSTQHWIDALTPPLEQHMQHLVESVKLLLPILSRSESELAEGKTLSRNVDAAFTTIKSGPARPEASLPKLSVRLRLMMPGEFFLFDAGVKVYFDGTLVEGDFSVKRGIDVTVETTIGKHSLIIERKVIGSHKKSSFDIDISSSGEYLGQIRLPWRASLEKPSLTVKRCD